MTMQIAERGPGRAPIPARIAGGFTPQRFPRTRGDRPEPFQVLD